MIAATNATTPVIQVSARRPRQAAIQNLPHRWMTRNAMNSSTLHRWTLLKKWPTGLVCHQSVPPSAIANPLTIAMPSAASVATPNTYTQDATYAGWRSGSSFCGGSTLSAQRRVRAVHIRASASSPIADAPARSGAPADSAGSAGSGAAVTAPWRRPGKGASSAMPKMATITATSTRLASEIVKIDQFRYPPGALRSTASGACAARRTFMGSPG